MTPSYTQLAFSLFLPVLSAATSPETVQQVLEQRWQSLRPQGFTQRNVLFQSVRAKGADSFIVNAIIRDYGPGYPANRFYGSTCIRRFDNAEFTIWYDGKSWHADGALTSSNSMCKDNPAVGASSFPLETLPGKPAPTGEMATGTAPPASGGMAIGKYECWANGRARMGLNFSVRANSQYSDAEGATGSFAQGANKRVTFRGGTLANLGAGYYTMYYEPQGVPTLSVRAERDNSEVSFCQLTR